MSEAAVLLVDDDAPIRRMLERSLSAEGYEVCAVADGGLALAQVERSLPDVIVLDIAMPGMDGLAVTRRLRAKGLPVPILLLTARDALSERVACGEQEDRDLEALGPDPPGDREAVEAGHRHVEHDHIGHRALDLREGGAAVCGSGDVVALRGQRALEHPPDRRVVVDEQDGGLGHHGESRGRSLRKL